MAANSLCPRCGDGFCCGVAGAAPCPCAARPLPDPLLAQLRERWSTCLCLECLRALADGEPMGAEGKQRPPA